MWPHGAAQGGRRGRRPSARGRDGTGRHRADGGAWRDRRPHGRGLGLAAIVVVAVEVVAALEVFLVVRRGLLDVLGIRLGRDRGRRRLDPVPGVLRPVDRVRLGRRDLLLLSRRNRWGMLGLALDPRGKAGGRLAGDPRGQSRLGLAFDPRRLRGCRRVTLDARRKPGRRITLDPRRQARRRRRPWPRLIPFGRIRPVVLSAPNPASEGTRRAGYGQDRSAGPAQQLVS
jgi:hypothetical protein